MMAKILTFCALCSAYVFLNACSSDEPKKYADGYDEKRLTMPLHGQVDYSESRNRRGK